MSAVEERIASLGLTVPAPRAPAFSYVPLTQSGRIIFLAGQIPLTSSGEIMHAGHVGNGGVSLENAREAAVQCCLNGLAQAKAHLGSLDRITRVLKVTGYVQAKSDFYDVPKVIDGASEFLMKAFGDAGKHARTSIGVATLPLQAPVEVEIVLEVDSANL